MSKQKSEQKSLEQKLLPPLDPLQRYTPDEAARYLRKSRAQLYIEITAGLIATIKEGKRRYVPGTEIAKRCALPTAA
jgi:hypothetical protein